MVTNLDYIMLSLQVKAVRQRLVALTEQVEAKEIEQAIPTCRSLIGKTTELLQRLSDVYDDADYMHEGFTSSNERLDNGEEEGSTSTATPSDSTDA